MKALCLRARAVKQIPYSIRYEYFPDVDGIKFSFKHVNNTPSNGDVISTITSVKHNVAIDDKMFAPKKLN